MKKILHLTVLGLALAAFATSSIASACCGSDDEKCGDKKGSKDNTEQGQPG